MYSNEFMKSSMLPWSTISSPSPNSLSLSLSLSEVGASDFALVDSPTLHEWWIQTFQEPSKSHNIVWAFASYRAVPRHPTSCVASLYKVTLQLNHNQSQQRSTLISLSKDLQSDSVNLSTGLKKYLTYLS